MYHSIYMLGIVIKTSPGNNTTCRNGRIYNL